MILVLSFSLVSNAQTSNDARELPPGILYSFEMKGAQTHRFNFDFNRNDFIQVRVEQKGIDVALKLIDSDGKSLATMDSPNGKNGVEILSFVAEKTGVFTIEVISFNEKAEPGDYTIQLEPVRKATAKDKRRVEVEKLFVEGITARDAGGNFDVSLAKLEEALKGWRELNDNYFAELTALQIKGIENFKKKETANNLFSEAFELLRQNTDEASISAKEKFETALKLFTGIGEKQGQVLSLVGLGNIAERQQNSSGALKNYNDALLLFRDLGNKDFEATILTNIGYIYTKMGDKQKALNSFNLALSIQKSLGNKEYEGKSLVSIGKIYSDLGDKQKALEIYNLALEIQKETGNKFDEALALVSIGKIYDDLGENQKAIEFFELALEIYKNIGDKPGELLTLNNLGVVFVELGENQKALKNFEIILKAYGESGDLHGEATTLNNLGKIYDDLGEKRKALENYSQSLLIRKKLGNQNDIAISLNNIGGIYSSWGNKTKALEFYEQALSLLRSVADKMGEATTLNNIGLVYSEFGESEKALDYYTRALAIRKNVSDKGGEATTLNNIGSVYSSLDEKVKALDFYRQSLTLLKKVGDRNGEARTLNNIGLIYSDLGNRKKSLEFYNLALPISRAVGDKEGESNTLSNIGSVYLAFGENEKALKYFELSLPLSQTIGDKDGEATTLNNIGRVFDDAGEKQKALEYFNRAVPVFRELGNRKNEGIVLSNIGRIYDDLGDKKKALDFYFKALPISQVVGDKTGVAVTLNNMMYVWNDLKNPRLAIFYGKQAVNVFQDLRSNIKTLDKETQRNYLKKIEKSYRRLADILVENGRIAEAEQVLAMLKEEEYFAFLRRGDDVAKDLLGKLTLSADEQAAFKRYEEIADKITALGKEQGELYAESLKFDAGKFPKQSRLDEIEKQIADANKVFNAFLDQLKLTFGEEDKRIASVESDTQALLKELGEPRTVIISTIAGEDKLSLIVTTSDAQRAHTVNIKTADLNRLVLEFRDAAKNPYIDPRPAGKKLYDVLFPAGLQKDLDNIKADTIVWSLDGTLRYAPISALWDGQKYLIERYAVSIITLASRSKLDAPPPDKTNWKVLGAGVSNRKRRLKTRTARRRNFPLSPLFRKNYAASSTMRRWR